MNVNNLLKSFSGKNNKYSFKNLLIKFTRKTISNEKVEDFIEMIISLDKQGQSTSAALKNIVSKKEKIINKNNGSTALDSTLIFYKDVKERFDESDTPTITTAMLPYFNKTEAMIAGASDEPMKALEAVIAFRNSNKGNKAIIIGAALMPLIYILISIGLINFFDQKVMRQMVTLVESFDKTPQGVLKLQIMIHDFVLGYQVYFLPFLVAVFAAYFIAIPTFKGEYRNFLEKVPIIGAPFALSRMINSGLFLKIVAFLYRNGATTNGALSAIRKNSTPFMKYEVGLIQEVHRLKGNSEDAFASTLFVGDVSYMLSVYLAADESTDHMESISNKINILVTAKIKKIAAIINLFGLLMVATYVILFILSNLSISDYLN